MRRVLDENEFREMLRGHLKDIGHIVTYCRRTGQNPEAVAQWLEEAAEELLELAHGTPARARPPLSDGQKPVSIRA